MENGTAWSNSSESSDDSSSPQLSAGMRHVHKNLVQPEVQAAPPAIEISFAPRESATSTPTRLANQKEEDEEEDEEDLKKPAATIIDTTVAPVKQEVPNGHPRYSRSLSHISEKSADGVVTDRLSGESLETTEVTSTAPCLLESDDIPHRAEPCFVVPESQEICPIPDATTNEPSCTTEPQNCTESSCIKSTTCESATSEKARPGSISDTCTEKDSFPSALSQQMDTEASRTDDLTKTETNNLLVKKSDSLSETRPTDSLEAQSTDSCLGEALSAVMSSLDDYRGQFPELQALEQELKLLEEALRVSGQVIYCLRVCFLDVRMCTPLSLPQQNVKLPSQQV